MFLLGHLGITLGLAWFLAWKAPATIDYRVVLFGGILPDLIDKPIGYLFNLETRGYAHTFVFLFTILVLSVLPRLGVLRLVGFGVATHYLLDRIWETPRIILWPAYGWDFKPAAFDAEIWIDLLLRDPYVQAGEIVGGLILVLFAWRKGLFSWTSIVAFVRHGTLPGAAKSQP